MYTVTVRLPEEFRRRVKRAAALNDLTMNKLATKLIIEYVEKHEETQGLPSESPRFSESA